MNKLTYLDSILAGQEISDEADIMKALQDEKNKVEELILKEFKDCNPIIKIAGSHAKGDAILESFDLDVCSYFCSDESGCGETLEDIFNNMVKCLEKEYHVVIKPTAIRLQNKSQEKLGIDCHIDVVPGRFVDGNTGDAYLHKSSGDKKYFKTNLKIHISHVRNSGLIDQIKLLKYWKIRFGLSIVKTFILELLVIEILKNFKGKSLDESLIYFWSEVEENIDTITIEDPANPYGNDLSPIFDASVKTALKSAASLSKKLADENKWEQIFGKVEQPSKLITVASIEAVASTFRNPVKPYSC